MLYLLSLADTCAVGERSYSNLDLEAMKEFYERALIAMTSEETAQVTEQRNGSPQEDRHRHRSRTRSRCNVGGGGEEQERSATRKS